MPVFTVETANIINAAWVIDSSGVDGTAGTILLDDGVATGATGAISTSTVIKKGICIYNCWRLCKRCVGKKHN